MYPRFKHEFAMKNYLDFIKEKKYKFALTDVRLSSHYLAIERGRYANIARNERICIFCNGHLVESEYHFILACPFYRELGQRFLKPYYGHWPTLHKFDDLMCKCNKNVILNLSKIIYFAFKSRQLRNV